MTIWKRLLWPLLWAAAALCVAKDCSNHIVGVEGEDIVLSPSAAGDGNLTRINWKKGENIVASSWFSFPPGKEKQRLSLDSSSGKLILKNLSKEDTGNYTAEVLINEKIKETCFDLKILVWPDINCTINNGTIQLSCTSPSQDLPLTYSWENIKNEEIISVKDSVVLLQRNPSHFQKITCYIIAFGLNASTSINLSDCIPVEEPDHQSRSRIHLIALPIILVLILVLSYCIKKYLKKRKESKIPNESESGAENARGNCKEGGPFRFLRRVACQIPKSDIAIQCPPFNGGGYTWIRFTSIACVNRYFTTYILVPKSPEIPFTCRNFYDSHVGCFTLKDNSGNACLFGFSEKLLKKTSSHLCIG